MRYTTVCGRHYTTMFGLHASGGADAGGADAGA